MRRRPQPVYGWTTPCQARRVREVAESLAINPNTVLKAYRELEHEGLVEGRPGLGTFVLRSLAGPALASHAALRPRAGARHHRRSAGPPQGADRPPPPGPAADRGGGPGGAGQPHRPAGEPAGAHGPIPDPAWTAHEVTLEDVVLAYLADPSAGALPGPAAHNHHQQVGR